MEINEFIGIIPARYSSTRFPGKPLSILGGKPVIQRVYEQASKVLNNVCVATDDERIYNKVIEFGGNAVMTRADHKSGTDRIAEAYEKIGKPYKVVINIQGDEPFIHPEQIESVMACFDDKDVEIATLGKRFTSMEAVQNPNSPKIVVDNRGFAMYFSRSVIPFVRGVEEGEWLLSLSIWAYTHTELMSSRPSPPYPSPHLRRRRVWNSSAGFRTVSG